MHFFLKHYLENGEYSSTHVFIFTMPLHFLRWIMLIYIEYPAQNVMNVDQTNSSVVARNAHTRSYFQCHSYEIVLRYNVISLLYLRYNQVLRLLVIAMFFFRVIKL